MEPFIALVAVTLAVYGVGALGVRRLKNRTVALRGGLAAMFALTGAAHFVGMRAELVSMVPPGLPRPDLLVTITGVLELAAAAGLLVRRTAPWAAAGLTALLVVMFPANVYAYQQGIQTDPLWFRTLLQVVFLAATVAVVLGSRRAKDLESLDSRGLGEGLVAGDERRRGRPELQRADEVRRVE